MSNQSSFRFYPSFGLAISRILRGVVVITAASLMVACANRGGAPVAEDTPLVAETSSNIEQPTLFKQPYLVKGIGKHQLDAEWTAQLGGDDGFLLHFRPAIEADNICAAGRGFVACYARNNGKKRWSRKVSDLSAGATIANGSVLLGTDEGEVIALSLADGVEQWRTPVGGEILSLVAVGQSQTGPMAVVSSSSGTVTALNAETGEVVWVQEQKVPRLTLRGNAAPLVVDAQVVSGFDNGRVASYQLLDGMGIWADELVTPSGRNELERLADVDGHLAHYRGDVFAASWGGKVGAWSLKRGRLLWKADIASVTGVAADLRRVYVADVDSALYSLDARSGRILWKRDDLVPESEKSDRNVVGTVTLDGAPLVLDNLGRLYYYERATGDLDFARTLTGSYTNAPAVDGKTVATLSRGGLLSVWTLAAN